MAFITPPLLSAAALLAVGGGFDRWCLSATVFVYLAALTRSALQTEEAFRETSRLKHEATTLAQSLRAANAHSLDVADEMRRRAAHDSLSGLLNRAGFTQALRERPAPTAERWLLLLDLDGFKSINDAWGHAAGDRVLAEVARRLRAATPPGGLAARLGGDEFAIMVDLGERRDADDLATRLIDATAAPYPDCETGRLGVSIGLCRADGVSLDDALVGADEALYTAKSSGRNRFRVFDASLRDRRGVRLDVERDLPGALAARQLELWYQPIFGQGGRAAIGFEALLRWRHPRHGFIAPPAVIRTAAVAGLAEPLLAFVLDEACATAKRLASVSPALAHVSVNVSPRELAQLPIATLALERLQRHGLPAAALGIEITEEAAVDLGAARDTLAEIRRAGIALAIDDFGVGYASLASIRDLKADRVKIDRSFVTGLAGAPEHRTLVAAIVSLGHAMRFDVVAEGVETRSDLDALQAAGCTLFQGFHLGRPMPAAGLLAWLQDAQADAA